MPHESAQRVVALALALQAAAWQTPGEALAEQSAQIQAAPRTVSAARRSSPVTIDGVPGEQAWAAAPVARDFWQRSPHEGGPVELPSEFRVLFDDEALYVAVRAFDPEPSRIRGLLTRRDEESASDWVWVSIDSYHDRRTAFAFGLNPASVQRDLLIYDDGQEDAAWNAVWDGAAAVNGQGWDVELRIPLGQLRFADVEEPVWGLQVSRTVHRSQEETHWSPWPKTAAGRVAYFGELKGLRDIESAGRLELTPYGVGGGALAPGADDPARPVGSLGLDMRYGLTSNLTLVATMNPDFGQVEADPSNVNLTAQQTFFPEKRPFFLDGWDIFRFGLGQGGDEASDELFYTRRIGAPPHGEPGGEEPARAPDFTTIYGATKLSGKTSSGWSVGALNAVVGEERVPRVDEAGNRDEQVIEPLTSYTVVRARKDLRQGRTTAGLAVTGVHRGTDAAAELTLHDQAYGAALDLTHRFWDDEWLLQVKVLGSQVQGSKEAVDATQRAPQRYFQRPDHGHVDYDPSRTSLRGYGAQYLLGRVGGPHLRGGIGGDLHSPGLEYNDLGTA